MKHEKQDKPENGFQRFRRTMATLTFEQKIDHIWTYYRGTVILMILIPFLLVSVLTMIFKTEPEVAFAGNFTNVSLSNEGMSYLVNDWSDRLNLDPEAETVKIGFAQTLGSNLASLAPEGVDGGLQVILSIASDDLDYVVCDQVGKDYYFAERAFLPLSQVLTTEQLSAYEEQLVYYTDEESNETIPVALKMTETAFFQDCVRGEGEIYLFFALKEKPHIERIQGFLEHLEDWEGAAEQAAP